MSSHSNKPFSTYPNRITVIYNGQVATQTLSPYRGPMMYVHPIGKEYNNAITYPTTHSIPGPYLQSYINLPNSTYMY